MKVQIGIEVSLIEGLDGFGVRRRNMSVAQVLPDDRAILGFGKAVIIRVPRPRFGLLYQ